MIDQANSFHTPIFRPSRFRGSLSDLNRDVAREPTPVEEIVASHTANKPSRALCVAYIIESLVTGLPLLALDLIVTGCGLLFASLMINSTQGLSAVGYGIWLQLPVLLVLQTLMLSMHQLYPGAGVSPIAELRGVVRSTVAALSCLSAMNVLLGQLPRIEFLTFTLAALCIATVLPLTRWGARQLLKRTSWWGLRVLLTGHLDDCVATYRQLMYRRAAGFIPVGYTCDASDAAQYSKNDKRLLGINSEASVIASKHMAPVAGVVSPGSESDRGDRLIFEFPSVVWIDFARAARQDFDTSNLPQVFSTRMSMPFLRFVPRIVKRCMDLAVCIPLLLVLAIPMLMIIVTIKIVSPGPVFFGHTRIGQHGSRFRAWKFRTMVTDGEEVLQQHLAENPAAREEWEATQKLKHDPRVIGVIGGFLRKWSLDELPQLWNVMAGQMSLVGPRPIVYDEIEKYSDGYFAYSHMMPGITGLWQTSGRNNTSYATRVSMDEYYARNWSPWLDFWLLLKTPIVVVTRDGAY